jgi:hypothetical protein
MDRKYKRWNMDTLDRIGKLEREMQILKDEIAQTLCELQATLPERTNDTRRWQKNAWMLALLNVLMAVVLFANVGLYVPNGMNVLGLNPLVYEWLHALWLAIAFVWLLLQMYPLALLLEQEDVQWQGIVWRNATAFFRSKPSWLLLVTMLILVIAVINTVIPAVWLIIAIVLLAALVSLAVRNAIETHHRRAEVRDGR